MLDMLLGPEKGLFFHQMIIHFPITYLLTALLFEFVWYVRRNEVARTVSTWMIYLGALSAIASVITGFMAVYNLPPGAEGADLVHLHRNLLLGVAIYLVVAAILLASFEAFRTGIRRESLFLSLVIAAIILTYGSDKGKEFHFVAGTGATHPHFTEPDDKEKGTK